MIADRVDNVMSKRRVGTVSEIELVHRSEQVRKVGTRCIFSGYCFFSMIFVKEALRAV